MYNRPYIIRDLLGASFKCGYNRTESLFVF